MTEFTPVQIFGIVVASVIAAAILAALLYHAYNKWLNKPTFFIGVNGERLVRDRGDVMPESLYYFFKDGRNAEDWLGAATPTSTSSN